MATLTIPENIYKLITELSFISLIESQQKLNVKSKSFSQADSWGQCFYRFICQESRSGLIDYLNFIVNLTISEIQNYRNTEFCKIIINHLNLSRKGIRNLCVTYAQDANILSQLNIILENIDIQLQQNKRYIVKDFKPPEDLSKSVIE